MKVELCKHLKIVQYKEPHQGVGRLIVGWYPTTEKVVRALIETTPYSVAEVADYDAMCDVINDYCYYESTDTITVQLDACVRRAALGGDV